MKLKGYHEPPEPRLVSECVSCTQPDADDRIIAFTELFKVILHPNQTSVGTLIVATRRHVPRLADLSPAESDELINLLKVVETSLERAFDADLINIYYQRNWAYRKENPDPPFKDGRPNPHVHVHIMPRYSRRVRFEGEDWVDQAFGEPFIWQKRTVDEDMKVAVISHVQQHLPIRFIEK